jgi:hypothetical protein
MSVEQVESYVKINVDDITLKVPNNITQEEVTKMETTITDDLCHIPCFNKD